MWSRIWFCVRGERVRCFSRPLKHPPDVQMCVGVLFSFSALKRWCLTTRGVTWSKWTQLTSTGTARSTWPPAGGTVSSRVSQKPSSETQGQIVGQAGNWGERNTTAEGEGAGRKGREGNSSFRPFSFPSRPRPLHRRFPLTPVSPPPYDLPLGLWGCPKNRHWAEQVSHAVLVDGRCPGLGVGEILEVAGFFF